jgi:hypothetical protein
MLDSVLHKFNFAGFAINAIKCHFLRPEMKFLGYITSDHRLRPDSGRIETIPSHPPPENQEELRKFLGICNFQHLFIVNYLQHVAPLPTLLHKGDKCGWSSTMQQTDIT